LMQLFPFLAKSLTSNDILALAKYSPLPESVVQELKEGKQQEAKAQRPLEQAMQQITLQRAIAEIEKMQAETAEKRARAMQAGAEGQGDDTGGKLSLEQMQAEADLATENQKFEHAKELKLLDHDLAMLKRDMELKSQGLKARPKEDGSEELVSEKDEQFEALQKQIAELAAIAAAPKRTELIRDESGQIAGAVSQPLIGVET
jgi:hypothetical protein